MKKIGILSDTHGMLRSEVMEALGGCDVILHGGDINKQKVLDDLAVIAPVHVVRGNNDKEWAEHIPETLTIELYGLKIFMVHNKKMIPKTLTDTDLIIYGHSHKYEEKTVDGIYYLNPGSCGPRRFNQDITLAILYLSEDGTFTIEKVLIPHTPKAGSNKQETIPADIGEKLPLIMKDLKAGKSVEWIAAKHKISLELSEQIARMYVTHPGIDKDGILRRLGL